MTPFAVGGPYQVQLTHNYADSPVYDSGVATIGPSVEYPYGYGGYYRVNLKLRKMIITHLIGATWGSDGIFWGPVVTSLTTGANLPQPAYFISYTAANPGILTSTATTIALDWGAYVTFNQGDEIVIGW